MWMKSFLLLKKAASVRTELTFWCRKLKQKEERQVLLVWEMLHRAVLLPPAGRAFHTWQLLQSAQLSHLSPALKGWSPRPSLGCWGGGVLLADTEMLLVLSHCSSATAGKPSGVLCLGCRHGTSEVTVTCSPKCPVLRTGALPGWCLTRNVWGPYGQAQGDEVLVVTDFLEKVEFELM